MLGVVFHAAESFGPRNFYWAVVDCSPSDLLEWFRFACHSFRLELFFVIAGFFARLVIHKRGVGAFVKNRTQRILVPLVVGWVVLYPLLVLLWLWGRSLAGRMGELGIPPGAEQLPLWKLLLGFFLTGAFLKKFDLTHLWFLHQLLILYAFVLGLRWLFNRLDTAGKHRMRLDRWFARINSWPGAILCFVAPSVPLMLLMQSWTVDTPKESLLPYPPTTLFYGLCFLIGWLLHRQPAVLDWPERRWKSHLALAVVLWVAFGALGDHLPFRQMTPHQLAWARAAYLLVYALMMWGFVLGFLGLFTRFFKQPSSGVRYVADSSYWIYVAHLPLVVALQILLGQVVLPWPLKYAAINAIAIPLLFLSYHYLVRGTIIGVQLNGRRLSLRWPWKSTSAS